MKPSNKKTAVAAAAGIAALAAATSSSVIYVKSDGGGSVYGYVKRYDELYLAKTPVQIQDQCYSSCTMGLAYPNVCFSKNAVLGFHPAYVPYLWGVFHYTIDPAATEEMRRHYPSDALAIINQHHGLDAKGGWLRPEITLIRATEFPEKYRCKES